MKGPWLIRSRITAATQFLATNPIVTFREFQDLNALPPSWTARILGYSYTGDGGDATTVRLTLRPPFNIVPNADDEIVLRAEALTTNTFSNICGPGGLVVPRAFGIADQNAQPPVATVTTGATFQVFFSTTGKSTAATFMLWYAIAGDGE